MKKLTVGVLILLLIVVAASCKPEQPSTSTPTVDSVYDSEGQPVTDNNNPLPEPARQPLPEPTPAPVKSKPTGASYSWYFRPNSEHQAPSTSNDINTMLLDSNAFYVLPNNDKKIYLTFDEGYENGYTGQILDILQANNVQAAFFITGHYLKTQPELVKRMKNEGHLVCNHTSNHPDLSAVSQDKFQQEVTSLEKEYLRVTGSAMNKYLRPPMGNYSQASLNYAKEMGYYTVFWSMAFKDWDVSQQPGSEYSYQHVVNNIHPGAVILLHAVSQSNTEALDRIIKELKAQGYTFSLFG